MSGRDLSVAGISTSDGTEVAVGVAPGGKVWLQVKDNGARAAALLRPADVEILREALWRKSDEATELAYFEGQEIGGGA